MIVMAGKKDKDTTQMQAGKHTEKRDAKLEKPVAKDSEENPQPAKSVVNKGDEVILHYTGAFEDGAVFDSSERHKQLLKFEVGAGQVIKGFDDAVIGMKKEEEKSFTVTPEEGYGMPDTKMVRQIRRDNLPKEPEPKEGMMIVLGFDNGLEFPARITGINGEIITLDLNHPLAGKTLNFKIKVVEIR